MTIGYERNKAAKSAEARRLRNRRKRGLLETMSGKVLNMEKGGVVNKVKRIFGKA